MCCALRAMCDYVLSLTELERANGTLLKNRGIALVYSRAVSGMPQYYESQNPREVSKMLKR